MKKLSTKIISVVLAVLTAALLFSSCASKTDEKLEYEITENNTIKITGYTDVSTRTEITVPDEIDGIPLTEIADYSLFNADSLQKITIGKNVETIGTWALTNNQRLKEFAVVDGNEYFTAVDGILFSKDMKTLVAYPPARNIEFNSLTGESLNSTTYEIPDGVEVIRSKAFYKCSNITEIKIPDSVTRIEEKSFFKVSALESLTLPKNLEYIGKDAFTGLEKVPEVTIPAGVTEIGEYAFYNCTSMLKITVENEQSLENAGKKWYPTDNGSDLDGLMVNGEKYPK